MCFVQIRSMSSVHVILMRVHAIHMISTEHGMLCGNPVPSRTQGHGQLLVQVRMDNQVQGQVQIPIQVQVQA